MLEPLIASVSLELDCRPDALHRVLAVLHRKACHVVTLSFQRGRADIEFHANGDRIDHVIGALHKEVCVIGVGVVTSTAS